MTGKRTKTNLSLFGKLILTLSLILGLGFVSMMSAYLISDYAKEDPQIINKAGTLRMLTYKVTLSSLAETNFHARLSLADDIDALWQDDKFYRFRLSENGTGASFQRAHGQWRTFRSELFNENTDITQLEQSADSLVQLIDQFVMELEARATDKLHLLRIVVIASLLLTLLLTGLILYWLKTRFEEPLHALTQQARQLSQGDFTARTYFERSDEIGILGKTLNKMSDTISGMYGDLEKRVDHQTQQLKHGHKTLQLLYDISRDINEKSLAYHDYNDIVERLRGLLDVRDIELCLLTEEGKRPYLQLQPEDMNSENCVSNNCADCVTPENCISFENEQHIYRYPLSRDQKSYGVLTARCAPSEQLSDWQQQLLRSVAEQLSLALNLKSEEENVRRLALMKERTVIARELHDSLAQALSYLKIQVVRLSKATEQNKPELIHDVTLELKEGLNSAYRQLRELLTTFRLKVDGGGLKNALLTTVQQLEERSEMIIKLHYDVQDIPLAPHEEVHLLQIIREAAQNAINHSQGTELHIRIEQENDSIHLTLEDNGIGIPDKAEKLNHYGLAIMQERSRHLGGVLHVQPLTQGGTGVYFSFAPEYLFKTDKKEAS
ncbi:MAG: histidine kinase [Gammaproteobacteria bacterium]|nr:histidine kinase [Gammaproteobacteria bacterium]